MITYSIYRNKFLEINLVVKRGISVSLYNIILFAIYALLVISAYNLINVQFGITNLTTIFILLSPVFILLEPIRILLQKLTRRIFYQGMTDRQLVLKEFSALVNSSLDLSLISASLIQAISDAIGSKEINILLKNA